MTFAPQSHQMLSLLATLTGLAIVSSLAAAQSTEFILDESAPAGIAGDADPWIASSAPAPGSDAALLSEARRLIAEGNPDRAKDLLDDWLEIHERTENPYLAEGYLLRGNALYTDGREYKALYDYETVIRDFSTGPEFVAAVEKEYEIGRAYLQGLRRRIYGLRIERSETLGEELVIRTQERLPSSELAEQAAMTLADYYFEERRLELAQEMYGIFIELYPDSELRKRAALRQIYCAVARFKGPRYDASTLIDARLLIEGYLRRYPSEAASAGVGSGLLNRIDESAAEQMFETASWYLKRNDEVSARFTMRRLIRKHPSSVAARLAAEVMQERGWNQANQQLKGGS